mmetsp:Transcript_120223/g.285655  ORF Transcript_120223/g.285655 Transcript_120223/m.285655 type:complete len:181 (+) Transcript_120223:36-578(+)
MCEPSSMDCPKHWKLYVFMIAMANAARPAAKPCAGSAVPAIAKDDRILRFFMLDEIRDAAGVTCFDKLHNLTATTDNQGYVPNGPWASCLEEAVNYEVTHKDWTLQPRFRRRDSGPPQGPAGQVIELFAVRAVEAQQHLEDCLYSVEANHSKVSSAAQLRATQLVSLLQEQLKSHFPARM